MSDINGEQLLDILQSLQSETNILTTVVTGRLQCNAFCPHQDEEGHQKTQNIAQEAVYGRPPFLISKNLILVKNY